MKALSRSITHASLAALAAFAVLAPALAQSAAPAGPPKEVDQIKPFEGAWACTGAAPEGPLGPAHKSATSVTFHKDLDGFWYSGRIEEARTPQNPHPLKGMAHWTYDPAGKKFVGLWVDNLGSWATQTATGWDGDKLVWLGEGTLNGKIMGVRDTFTKKGADMQHLGELQMDGKWLTVQDETCKRKGSKK